MSQREKVLPTKPENMGLVPRTHLIRVHHSCLCIVLLPPHISTDMCTCVIVSPPEMTNQTTIYSQPSWDCTGRYLGPKCNPEHLEQGVFIRQKAHPGYIPQQLQGVFCAKRQFNRS